MWGYLLCEGFFCNIHKIKWQRSCGLRLHDVFSQFVVERRTRGGGAFVGTRGETREDREKNLREKIEKTKKKREGLDFVRLSLGYKK